MKNKLQIFAAIAVIFAFATLCGCAPQTQSANAATIDDYMQAVARAVDKNGLIVYDLTIAIGEDVQTKTFTEANPCQNSYSVAKAFCVHAVGILIDRHLLSESDLLTEVLKDEIDFDYESAWDKVTLRHLLTHKSGLQTDCLDIDNNDASTFGDDFLKRALQTPLTAEPDEEEFYTDAAYYLIARMVEATTGKTLNAFLYDELFAPTAFREVAWSTDPQGHTLGGTGLYVRTEDMAKLGVIYANGGVLNGKRYISSEWIQTVLQNGYEFRPLNGADGWYGKFGINGQLLAFNPRTRETLAWHGYGNFGDELIAALVSCGK